MAIPPLAIAAGVFAIVLGLPFGLYILLTRGQRLTTREIRTAAVASRWRYRPSRWQGNPIAFRIDGRTKNGVAWRLTCGNTRGYDRGWSVALNLLYPTLAGEADLSVEPRDPEGTGTMMRGPAIPPDAASRIATVSRAAAGAVRLLRESREYPSGLAGFDAAYQVLVRSEQLHQPPVDPVLAGRMLRWPAGAVAPHSILVWRDPFGLQFQARLPAPPNWMTVSYLLNLADDIIARIPPPAPVSEPPGFLDRLFARLGRA